MIFEKLDMSEVEKKAFELYKIALEKDPELNGFVLIDKTAICMKCHFYSKTNPLSEKDDTIPDLCRKIEKLEKENSELRAELQAWKKTFEQFEEKWDGIKNVCLLEEDTDEKTKSDDFFDPDAWR